MPGDAFALGIGIAGKMCEARMHRSAMLVPHAGRAECDIARTHDLYRLPL